MAFLSKLGGWLAGISARLVGLGALGLFAVTLMDSAFIPLPTGPDLLMITLSAMRPAMMPVYALFATAGSTVGCVLLYSVARKAGTRALGRISPARRQRIENLLGRYDVLAIMVPALLPPPFPFKIFVLSAGVFKLKTVRFILAIFTGRAIRFLLEGWLAIEYGDEAWRLIRRQGWKALVIVALLVIIWWVIRFYIGRSSRPGGFNAGAINSSPEDAS